jgi:sulfate adenylyltransferase
MRRGRGVCIWLTGLPGSGKTTLAIALGAALAERGHAVSIFDGDEVRAGLSLDLGFSKPDRDENVRRVTFAAAGALEEGKFAICALVSPYEDARERARQIVGEGRFLEVFVDTPLSVCEARDTKGLYARARQGKVTAFTGVDDPYEVPIAPDVVVSSASATPEENAGAILRALVARAILHASLAR